MNLTKRQRRILDYIKEFAERRGYAPSLMEIARHFGLRSPATVHKHLKNLEAKGALRRRWNHSRAIEVLPEAGTRLAFDLELAGTLSAGEPPRLAPSEQTVPVPPGLVGQGRTFVLRVSGDGFRDALLRDGDFLVVEDDPDPADGAVVLALLDGGRPTLGTLRRDRDRLRIEATSQTPGSVVLEGPLRLQGRLLGVLRRY